MWRVSTYSRWPKNSSFVYRDISSENKQPLKKGSNLGQVSDALKLIDLTSVPLKKIVTCVGIYSLCHYHEFCGKFLFYIANSSCQKL